VSGNRHLLRNSVLNLFGLGLPIVVAIFAIPVLIHGMGTERFGVLALAWMTIGYFSLFDLGLGRALTQLIADRRGLKQESQVPALSGTGLLMMLVLGLLGGLLLAGLAPWLVGSVLRIPPELSRESHRAFLLLSLAVPVVVATAGLRAILEAYQRFDFVNAVRVPLGILTYLAPVLVVLVTPSLTAVVASLLLTRLLALIAHTYLCGRAVPGLIRTLALRRALVRPLLRFGGWMTVSNLLGPLMTYFDRFLIGALLSMTAVAYYVTPYEVVTRFWIIPGAIMGVFFPAFAESFVRDRARTSALFSRSMRGILLLVFPLCLVLSVAAEDGLMLWLGADFARESTRVAQWLVLGVFINSVGQVAFGLIQGVGRPDITAKLHMVELPVYVVVLWWLIARFGVEGAAMAWTLRIGVDTLLLLALSRRYLSASEARMTGTLVQAGAGAALIAAGMWLEQPAARGLFLLLVLPLFALAAWSLLLDRKDRIYLRSLLNRRRAPVSSEF
jgi:O-antigen/teichoic acid export membrane protein